MIYEPIWGAIIAWYLFLAGLGGGAFATAVFVRYRHPDCKRLMRVGRLIAPIVVIIGLCLLMFDAAAGFAHPLRFALLLTNFGSVMTWGVVFLAVFVVVALIVLVLDLMKREVPMWLDCVGLVMGLCVAIYTGCLLGVCQGFPLWNSALLPILFLVSAVSTGMAAVLLVGVFYAPDEFNEVVVMKKFHFWLPVIEFVLVAALLFIPAKAPMNMFTRESDPGLELYSSGVMIMDKCTDLLPPCYAFARGVVDSPDLSLNISREMLQHDRQLKLIAANLGKKIKSELTKLMTNDREKYEQFHAAFGMMLRAGAVTETGDKVDEIKDLLLYHTSETKLVSLKEYVDAMPAEQTKIYFACGENVKRLLSLPQAELLHEKGFDVLCMTSQIDEYFVDTMKSYADKPFCNIATDDLGLETEEEKKETEAKQAEDKDLLDFVKETLGDQVASVRLSNKLVSSAVCLSTEGGVTLEMERYFKSMPGAPTDIRAIRVLELNANHHAYQAMKEAFDAGDKDKAARIARILHAQALLIAGEPLEDPAAYSELVCTLI